MPRTHPALGTARWLSPFLTVLVALALACAPAAPSPTAAPAKPTEAPKPAATTAPAKPTEAPAAKPAEAKPAASPAAKAEAKQAASPAAKAVPLPKPEVSSVKIGMTALLPDEYPTIFANDLGLYKKYGLENVETPYFDGVAKALQALVAGQVDANVTTGGPVLSSLKTGSPLVQVSMHITKVTYLLAAQSNIKSAADLRGKSVAISQFGGDSHAAALIGLRGLGLTDKDVTIQQIGGTGARLAALKAGSVAAAPFDTSLEEEIAKQGYSILIRLVESNQELARAGLVVPADWARRNPNTVLALVGASLEAQQLIFSQFDKAVDGYTKWIQAKDRVQAETALRDYMKYARRDFRWSREGWENLKEVQIIADAAIRDVDVPQAYTFEYLDKLKELGFNAAVGVPGS